MVTTWTFESYQNTFLAWAFSVNRNINKLFYLWNMTMTRQRQQPAFMWFPLKYKFQVWKCRCEGLPSTHLKYNTLQEPTSVAEPPLTLWEMPVDHNTVSLQSVIRVGTWNLGSDSLLSVLTIRELNKFWDCIEGGKKMNTSWLLLNAKNLSWPSAFINAFFLRCVF